MRKKMIRKSAEQVAEVAKGDNPNAKPKVRKKDLLSSGSTMLNLACTNSPFGAFIKGRYHLLVGDSASGKTFLSMTCLAEACASKYFDNYRLIYDNVEDGCLLNLAALFNEEVEERIEPPATADDGSPVYSFNVEEFWYNFDDAVEKAKADNQPFVYVLDSMDSLSSEAETSKFDQHKDAYRKGKQAPGSYGDGKAKRNSEGLRKALKGLRDTGSILIIISQTRDNIGIGFEQKTRSGGRALRFYATTEVWSSLAGTIKKTIKGKPRKIGIHAKLQVKKNRITGQLHEVTTDIYPRFGIDDLGSIVEYLLTEKWWTKSGNTINAEELDFRGTKEKLISYIEDNNLELEVRKIAGRCWHEIQEGYIPDRKRRY